MDVDKHDLRKNLLKVIDSGVKWIPAVGRERISAMVSLRPDWCLSRQRHWGVPIPAVACTKCNKKFSPTNISELVDVMEKIVGQIGIGKKGREVISRHIYRILVPKATDEEIEEFVQDDQEKLKKIEEAREALINKNPGQRFEDVEDE